MRISLAVTTHDEGHYVRDLINSLLPYVKERPDTFELVVVDDHSTEAVTVSVLEWLKTIPLGNVHIRTHKLDNDFATHKNYLNSQCTGDWILNLDADERLPEGFLDNLDLILEANPSVQAYWLPRVNTVEGLTLDHVRKWGWVLSTLAGHTVAQNLTHLPEFYTLLTQYDFVISRDEEAEVITYHDPIINWPDPQMRLYRNLPDIRWEGKVHERLTGFAHYSMFPVTPEYAIIHAKVIERQEAQNNYYDTLQR